MKGHYACRGSGFGFQLSSLYVRNIGLHLQDLLPCKWWQCVRIISKRFHNYLQSLRSHAVYFSVYVTSLIGLLTRPSSMSYAKCNMASLKHSSTRKQKSRMYQGLPTWNTGWHSGASWWVQPVTCRTSPSGCNTSPRSSSLWSIKAVSSHVPDSLKFQQLLTVTKLTLSTLLWTDLLCTGSEITVEISWF